MPILLVDAGNINSTTTGNQLEPSVAKLTDGRFVVTFRSDDTADGSGPCVRARIFNADGTPVGLDFIVNSTTASTQFLPSVFGLANGGFVVTFASGDTGDGSSGCVRARIFDSTGAPTGADFIVNTSTADIQTTPSVTQLTDGRFVVAFRSDDIGDGSGPCVRARLFEADGTPAGADFFVNSTTENNQLLPSVAALPGGHFVVTFISLDSSAGVRARIFDSQGVPVSDDFIVNTTAISPDLNFPSVTALPDGRFFVTWQSGEIRGRLFNADGSAVANDFVVNYTTQGLQSFCSVTVLADGRLLVTYTSDDLIEFNQRCVRARLLDPDGTLDGIGPLISDFVIQVGGTDPSVVALDDGRFVVLGNNSGEIQANIWNPTVFSGTGGTDIWQGGNFADIIAGALGNDVLHGRDGDDQIDGGAGADQMLGGQDNDTYVVDDAGDVVTELANQGTDTVQTTLGVYSMGANVENLTFTNIASHLGFGNTLANVFTGSGGDDTFVGDTDIFAQVTDTFNGGGGSDTFHAEFSDIVNGGAGTDFLFQVNSNPWNINLGTTSIEWMSAGFGSDTINAATQTASVEVFAGGGNDTVTGSAFNDFLWLGAGNDTAVGGNGDDMLFGDIGADSLTGGDGNDNFYVDSADTLISGGNGIDNLYWTENAVGANIDMAASSLEWAQTLGGNDTLNGAMGSANLEVYAGGGTDIITGGSGADFLWGEGGNDTIAGNGGSDTLVGGTGADTLTGGAGLDTLYANSGNGADGALDTFVFTNNWGTDFVYDFEVGTDKLDMTGVTGIHSISDVTITSSGGNAQISFGSNQILVVGKAGQITASDFLFDSHAGDGTGEINATLPFDQIIGSPNPILINSALDFGNDPYDASDFAELTAGGQELISLGGSSAPAEAFSFEVFSRTSNAALVKTQDEITYNVSPHENVDYTADISGTLFAVSVTRAFAFPLGTPVTLSQMTNLLTTRLDDLNIATNQVSAADHWDREILHVMAYDQQVVDTVAAAWNGIDASTKSNITLIVTQTYGQDAFLY